MQIKDSVALVTGANRGIGRAFVDALLERGARRIYAAGGISRAWTRSFVSTHSASAP